MNKTFIGIITQNEKQNIDELTSIAHCFDGLAAVDHKSTDGTYELLNERKGEGFVEQIPYYGHHGHSMNHFLLNPKVEFGSWVLLRDSNERVAESFAKNINDFIGYLLMNDIGAVYQYSKLLMFRRGPRQYFANTPHWGFQGVMGKAIQIDQSGLFKSDEEYCYSVRKKNRSKYHFVLAYARYYLMLDSNHLWLGLDKAEAAGITLQDRETRRVQFLIYLDNKGYEKSLKGLKQLVNDGLDDEARKFFNSEKVLNDYYRHEALGLEDFEDNHDHKNLITIQ